MRDRGAIYLVQGDGLIEMEEAIYAKETHLQELLASYPKLLAGEQMTPETPRRWLLIRREMAIPDEEEKSGRWSVDHLFIDHEAVPTLVEVKRSSDTRLRREVVGQMLDYAANAVTYWPIERLEGEYERTCLADGVDPLQRLEEFLEGDESIEGFWEQARTNLKAGRIRMVFVADVIPTELRQIVRFLQTQLNPAEAYAVEVPQYAGQGQTALVPRLVTESVAETVKATASQHRRWTRDKYFAEVTDWSPGEWRRRSDCSSGLKHPGCASVGAAARLRPLDPNSITRARHTTRSMCTPTVGWRYLLVPCTAGTATRRSGCGCSKS